MSNDRGGKRSKNYYVNFNKKQKGNVLAPGSKGFILTCNMQEQSAVREAYNILNEYADQLYGQAEATDSKPELLQAAESNIEDDLEVELNALKNITHNKRRFYQLYTGVKNVLFVQTEIKDPCKLVLRILEDLKETKQQKTKYLLRLIPVLDTCKPFTDNFKKTVTEVLEFFLVHYQLYAEGRVVGYAVQFKARNNHKSLKKDDVFNIVNEVVREKCPLWKIDLNNPELILNVDVLTNACCFGILPDYSLYKKYNLIELVKQIETKTEKTEVEKQEIQKSDESQKCALLDSETIT